MPIIPCSRVIQGGDFKIPSPGGSKLESVRGVEEFSHYSMHNQFNEGSAFNYFYCD